MKLKDLQVATGISVDVANQEIEKSINGNVNYSFSDVEIGANYQNIQLTDKEVILELTESQGEINPNQYIKFKLQAVPKVNAIVTPPHESRLLDVPKVTGLTLEEAKKLVQKSGLKIGDVRRRTAKVKKETIVSQNPEAGIKVQEGTKISLLIHMPGKV